ncbi:MAG: SpoIIE family protein phosphatase [Bacteroidales bacterium]
MNVLHVLKPDRQPISIYPIETDFTNNEFHLQKGDILYMFTDGFIDQIGGLDNKKYMKRNFKRFLLQNSHYELSKQSELLQNEIEDWKGICEQVDDILVLGIKI